jgi:hypothetical protein
LDLWYCAEDIACFLEQSDILTIWHLETILSLDVNDLGYIQFMRHISYRIHVYTKNNNSVFNWLTAEGLLRNKEWRQALIGMASYFNKHKKMAGGLSCVHSEQVKKIYETGRCVTDIFVPEA